MHPLLLRQLKRLGLNPVSSPASSDLWRQMLERVGRVYEEADNGRALLERSLALTSQEMQSLHERLQASHDEVLKKQQEAVLKLSKSATLHAGDLTAALREITEAAAKMLGIERASAWLFDSSSRILRCLDLYQRTEDRHSSGIELPLAAFPEYVRAVRTEEVIAADDARQDERTKEFTKTYLIPLGITSMLDVPIRIRGEMVGVVCCEHVGPKRQWTVEEIAFCTSIAAFVSLAFDAEERQRLQEETVRSNRFLDSVIENLPIMVFVKDAEQLRFLRWNRHAEELVGLSRHEVIGRSDHDLFPAPQADAFANKDREVLSRTILQDIPEERIDTKTNGLRLLHTRKIPIHDDRGVAKYLLGISEDITERRSRDAALRESEEKYRELFESSQDAIMLLFPPQWTFSAGNPATIKLFGARDLTHFTSMGPWDLSPEFQPDGGRSADKVSRAIEIAMREGSHFFEWTHTKADGQEFSATVLLTRIMLKGQVGLQAIVRDISQQKRAEAELKAVSAFHQAIIEAALDAVVSIDRDGIITGWNRRAETIFGWRADEAIGRKIADTIVPRQYRDAHRQGLRRYLETGTGSVLDRRIEISAMRRDGSEFPVELAVTAMSYAGNHSFTAFISDISLRKQSEEVLRRAKEVAEAANVAKSQFLANMSHEIRTPMNGVLGMTELLLTTVLDERQRHLAVTVQRSARALLGIINDILDFSKMEAGKLRLETIDLSLHAVVQEILDLVGESARVKGIRLSRAIPEGVPFTLRGDPIRLRQVLLNLVGNAIKFTERGAVSIEADLLADQGDQVIVRMTVKDTGIGISSETQAHIFDAFAQADGSTTRQFGGTGLGLAIAKRLTALMGGEIGVESCLGQGSAFWFTVRLLKGANQVAAASASSGVSVVTASKPCGGERRVLVAEDNPVNTEVAIAMLEILGCQVDSVSNGRAAVEASARKDFDLILMDCQMPDMDGLEATRLIRQRETGGGGLARRVPIVALTAHAMKGDREQCLAAGMDDYLTKPFTHETLGMMVNRWLTVETRSTGDEENRRVIHK